MLIAWTDNRIVKEEQMGKVKPYDVTVKIGSKKERKE